MSENMEQRANVDYDIDDALRHASSPMGRRNFLMGLAGLGAAGLIVGCSDSSAQGPSTEPPVTGGTSGTTANPGTTAATATTAPVTSVAGVAADSIPGPDWQGGIRGGTGLSVWQDSTVNFDPLLAYGRADYYNLANFYRGLAFFTLGAEPQLDLAETLDVSADQLTYTFTLREGLTFHHGRAVTAEDFKWTFERACSPEQASWVQGFLSSVDGHAAFVAGEATEITGITAPDDRTVVVQLTAPDVRLLSILGIPPFYVLPREEVERLGDTLSENPVGAGPYRFESFDGAGSAIIGTRFEDYVYRDHLPYLDTVECRWAVSEDLQYLQVSRGEADLSMGVPTSVLGQIRSNADEAERLREEESFTISWWAFDVTQAPFDDPLVRRAVNHAIDHSRAEGLGLKPTGHFFPPGLLGYSDDAPIYQYDPDKARALLEEAGVTDLSFTIGVLDSGSASNGRRAQLMQQDLAAVGIEVTLEQRQETAFDLGETLRGTYPMWNMGWGMGLPDPSELVSSLIGTDAPSNYMGYSNPRVDELGVEAIGEADRVARGAIYAELEAVLLEDAPMVFSGVGVLNSFRSSRLQNYSFDPVLWTYWDRYWLDEG